MPGLSFVYTLNEDINNVKHDISKSLDSITHDKRYKKNILLHEKSFILGETSYVDYPIKSFENDNFIIYLEGVIYNKQIDLLQDELFSLAEIISSYKNDRPRELTNWVLSSDGDFLLCVINKKSNIIYFINDALGRLPLYYHRSDKQLIISRELRFIANLFSHVRFDKMAIAQTLLLGFPLHKQTLLENVHRMKPASLISINLNTTEITNSTHFRFNFEIKDNCNKSIKANARELASLFTKACRDRAETFGDFQNILALSGGLDSRAIAAGLWKSHCNFSALTRLSYDRRENQEVIIAKQVAEQLDIDWKVINANPPKGQDMLALLRMKNGMNSLNMGLFIPYFNKILDQIDHRIIYYTGDGGNYSLPSARPTKKLKSIRELANYIISNQQRLPLDYVVALTDVKKYEIIEELENLLLSYPEKDINQKYVHFIKYDRATKFTYEGEDRNRFYFWSVAPFYSIGFYDYAANCPDEQKAYYNLYREFFIALAPELAKITNRDWNTSLLSRKTYFTFFMHSLRRRIPRNIKNMMKRSVSRNQDNQRSIIMKCLLNQMNNCDEIYSYISKTSVKSLADNFNKDQIHNLFTITSTIEDLTCKSSILDKYYQSNFT